MSEIKDYVLARNQILTNLKRELIGPKYGDNETLEQAPHNIYMSSILYPQNLIIEEDEDDKIGVESEEEEEESDVDYGINLANERYPSSMGISFFVEGNNPLVDIYISVAIYKEDKEKKSYIRNPVKLSVPLTTGPNLNKTPSSIKNIAEVRKNWKKISKNIYLVTISLVNTKKASDSYINSEECLFQAEIKAVINKKSNGKFKRYHDFEGFSDDKDKILLDLIHASKNPVAVGHGISVDWDDEKLSWVKTTAIPSFEVKRMTADIDFGEDTQRIKKVLDVRFLSDKKNKNDIKSGLLLFLDHYKNWIEKLDKKASKVASYHADIAEEQVARCNHVSERIKRNINDLFSDDKAFQSFIWANKAMLIQRTHSEKAKENPGGTFQLDENDYRKTEFFWRPFQLAFILLSIGGIINEDDIDERETVDLLWFPTGGGKTEAYLTTAAFTEFYLRLTKGEKAFGTNVITRYSLRALTAQQFLRTGYLITAMEYLRQKNTDLLGNAIINLGLFVGSGTTPNTIESKWDDGSDAFSKLRDINPQRPENPFILDKCPWCNSPLILKGKSKEKWGFFISEDKSEFKFKCTDPNCRFHQEIPVNIVDEMLYKNPPSFIIGTVDKFARLTWEPKIFSFFGKDGSFLPPSLIIQDELHLMSGPLGTIMGLYETAIEKLCTLPNGIRPKILASSATVRNVDYQIKNLFERKADIFPPTGIDIDDSFFAVADKKSPGRLYVGIMNPSKSGLLTNARVFSALLHYVEKLSVPEDVKDQYLTLLAYYNSMRELGKNLTLVDDDVIKWLQYLDKDSPRMLQNVEELNSTKNSAELRKIMDNLGKNREVAKDNFIDVLLATNMVSVGIDIPRLGLMAVVGQPLNTAEYIQATSRVGRIYPGLVITIYSPTKSRDKSHYERFNNFHSSFYKNVEPNGITPFSVPSLKRALHAVFIILVREKIFEMRENQDADKINDHLSQIEDIKRYVISRVKIISPSEASKAEEILSDFIDSWKKKAEKSKNPIIQEKLRYHVKREGKTIIPLIESFEKGGTKSLPTLNSMRNVESEYPVKIIRGH